MMLWISEQLLFVMLSLATVALQVALEQAHIDAGHGKLSHQDLGKCVANRRRAEAEGRRTAPPAMHMLHTAETGHSRRSALRGHPVGGELAASIGSQPVKKSCWVSQYWVAEQFLKCGSQLAGCAERQLSALVAAMVHGMCCIIKTLSPATRSLEATTSTA